MIHTLKTLLLAHDLRGLVEYGGILLVCTVVFVETGMFVGFFLPGDSLLVIAGVVAGTGRLNVAELLAFATLCAISGDQLGYWIGRRAGHTLYERRDSRFFKRKHLESAHDFYEEYGVKTVILARFVPIIRTFCPPVAGAARMSYRRYLAYDVVGGFLWVWSMVLLGLSLTKFFPGLVKDARDIDYVILAVIFLSLIPTAYHAWKSRHGEQARHTAAAPPRHIDQAHEPNPGSPTRDNGAAQSKSSAVSAEDLP
jgi:membrane-associated protein